MKCKTTKFVTLSMLEPSLTYLCNIVHGVVRAHRSCYASNWYFNFDGLIYVCFLSTISFISSVHLMGLELKWCPYLIAHILFCVVILSLFAWLYFHVEHIVIIFKISRASANTIHTRAKEDSRNAYEWESWELFKVMLSHAHSIFCFVLFAKHPLFQRWPNGSKLNQGLSKFSQLLWSNLRLQICVALANIWKDINKNQIKN